MRIGLAFFAIVLLMGLVACSSNSAGAASRITGFAASRSDLTNRGGADTLTWTSSAAGFTLAVSPSAGVILNGTPYRGPVSLPGIANSATVVLPPNPSAKTSNTYTFTLTATGVDGTVLNAHATAQAKLASVSYTVFTGTAYGFTAPTRVAVAASGDVWVSDCEANAITEIPADAPTSPVVYSNAGNPVYPPFSAPIGLAVDGSGNVWVANVGTTLLESSPVSKPCAYNAQTSGGWVTEIPAAGTRTPVIEPPTSYCDPYNLAVDGTGNVWVTTRSQWLCELPASDRSKPPVLYDISSVSTAPYNVTRGVAVDATGNVWVADAGGGESGESLVEIPVVPNGNAVLQGLAYGFSVPYGVAVDPSGDVWVSNHSDNASGNSVTEILAGNTSDPHVYSGPTYAFAAPAGVAVDGSGDVWVTNSSGPNGGSLTEIAADEPGDPIVYAAAAYGFADPKSVAVDGAGNVWVTNATGGATGIGSVTELEGVAAPLPFHVPLGQ